MALIGYARVSTEDQATFSQLDDLRAAGFQVVFEEKASGASRARPELPVVHFFIAISHDRLGDYEAALEAYETFLARADARVNQLEIEKVNLRLPSLRNQIKRGEGVKKDKRAQ